MTARPVAQSLFPEIQAEKAIGPILPSVFTGTNAELMRAVAPLYLTGSVVDVTYGEGKWWTLHRPASFTAHDLYKLDGVDFRALPEADRSIDAVVFDPPYVTSGNAATTASAAAFRDRYGIDTQYGYGDEHLLTDLVLAGLAECCRVSSGFVLVKAMEFVSSRAFRDVPTEIINAAAGHGWGLWDRIVHHTGAGPGGHNIFQPVRARRHHSYLLVFRRDVHLHEAARLRKERA